MRFSALVSATVLCLACGAWTLPAADVSPSFSRHAVLVGCTEYRHLEQRLSLAGPANDVGLMRQLLIGRFGFTPNDILELTQQSPAHLRPDRDHIVRVMDDLVQRVHPGDEVFILFAGHGSQQPSAQSDASDYEPDGLDEVFLPADVTDWKAKQEVVRGIPDDQIHRWLTAIRDKGAFVFFVADTCHSGTLSRGPEEYDGSKAKFRHVPAELLTSPEELNAAAGVPRASRAAEARTPADSGVDLDDGTGVALPGGLAVFAAVPANALEREHPMPPNDRFLDPSYGRLSYAIHHVLTQSQAPLTYRELAQHVAWLYQRWGWEPLGGIDGSGLDREVLGKREWKDRSTRLLTRNDDGSLHVNQGLAHGLTENSILRVLPPVGASDPNQALGYVLVTGSGPVTAEVEPVAYAGTPRVESEHFPNPARCEIEVVDYGQLQISVRVRAFSATELSELASAGVHLSEADAATVARVAAVVDELAQQPRSLVRCETDDATADVYLLLANEGAYLRRRGEPTLSTSGSVPPQYFGPYSIGPALAARLERDLRTVAQAINLRRLAADEELHATDDRPVVVRVSLGRAASSAGPFTDVADLTQATFTDGDYLRVTLTNDGRLPVDLTLLYVDAASQIRSHFPTPREALTGLDNTLAPRQSHAVTIRLNDTTVGLEDLLILAVARDPATPPVNFAFLSQPGLTRSGYDKTRGGAPLPLDRLLTAGLFEGSRGSSTVDAAQSFSVQRLTMTVVKKEAR